MVGRRIRIGQVEIQAEHVESEGGIHASQLNRIRSLSPNQSVIKRLSERTYYHSFSTPHPYLSIFQALVDNREILATPAVAIVARPMLVVRLVLRVIIPQREAEALSVHRR
jgi:hypothetical protein